MCPTLFLTNFSMTIKYFFLSYKKIFLKLTRKNYLTKEE